MEITSNSDIDEDSKVDDIRVKSVSLSDVHRLENVNPTDGYFYLAREKFITIFTQEKQTRSSRNIVQSSKKAEPDRLPSINKKRGSSKSDEIVFRVKSQKPVPRCTRFTTTKQNIFIIQYQMKDALGLIKKLKMCYTQEKQVTLVRREMFSSVLKEITKMTKSCQRNLTSMFENITKMHKSKQRVVGKRHEHAMKKKTKMKKFFTISKVLSAAKVSKTMYSNNMLAALESLKRVCVKITYSVVLVCKRLNEFYTNTRDVVVIVRSIHLDLAEMEKIVERVKWLSNTSKIGVQSKVTAREKKLVRREVNEKVDLASIVRIRTTARLPVSSLKRCGVANNRLTLMKTRKLRRNSYARLSRSQLPVVHF